MPRAKNKEELIESSNLNFIKMLDLIGTFTENECLNGQIPFENRDKNIRDILVHLHHWHLMFMQWYKVGMTGEKPDMPALGYTWKTTPELNHVIWKKYQNTTYDEANKMINKSFEKVQNIINSHTNEELFQKKRFKWTGTTSLASYLISTTSSHYDWAHKILKKYKKLVDKS